MKTAIKKEKKYIQRNIVNSGFNAKMEFVYAQEESRNGIPVFWHRDQCRYDRFHNNHLFYNIIPNPTKVKWCGYVN